jgi:multisubunit Na+/H+ antiporter MnhE subunit
MLTSKEFYIGVIAGFVIVYAYHRFVGIPSNAPGSKRNA